LYTDPLDVFPPIFTSLMHITQKATIHNVCVDAPSNHPATCKNSYAHDKKMGAHYYKRRDVPSSDSSG